MSDLGMGKTRAGTRTSILKVQTGWGWGQEVYIEKIHTL